MVKFFKIIEKIVWVIAALAIVAILAMVFIGAFANFDKVHAEWSSYLPYLYGAAAIVVIYKIIVLHFTSIYQKEIDAKIGVLTSLVDSQKEEYDASQNENAQSQKLDAIIEAVKQIPQTDTYAIIAVLQERIPEVVKTLVDQQVTEIKRNLMLENEKRMREINVFCKRIGCT